MLKRRAAIQRALTAALAFLLNVSGGKGRGHASGYGKVFLPVFFLKEDSGIFPSPGIALAFCLFISWIYQRTPFFLPAYLPVAVKPPQHGDFRPGWGGRSAFHTA